MNTEVFSLSTGDRRVVDITALVEEFVARSGESDGLVNVFAPHATAGIALIETRSGTEEDLASAIERLLPRDDIYVHRHGSKGHGGDHVLPAFVAPSLMIPVIGGKLSLGTWQSVVFVDPNRDNPERNVRLSFVPG
jgi:secondary thiamine-phosphate synthase enzyme